MKIAIDISQILYGTGVSVYTRHLVTSLLKVDADNQYLLFGGSLRRYKELKEISDSFIGNYVSKTFAFPPTFANLIWNKLHMMPVEKLVGLVDVVHTSDWSEPPAKAKKVTTVHDLYPFIFPRLVHPKVLDAHKMKMSWVLKESSRIIVPSESTLNDLVKFGANPEIIRVVPEAPSVKRATEKEVADVKKRFKIQGDYLVSVGATPLKNTPRIIEAFGLATPGRNLKLVIVGKPTNLSITDHRNVRTLGHVESSEYGALLTGSKGLIFPSIYEGYGIPILDAFSCGIPVVTSNTSSMKEVGGDAAILVDPMDTSSVSEGIKKVLQSPKSLVLKGSKRVSQFSWEKTAKGTMKAYSEAILA